MSVRKHAKPGVDFVANLFSEFALKNYPLKFFA
ncbi:hypothetical protein BH11PSE11_BH11PSE11_34750 [soil metagenome]